MARRYPRVAAFAFALQHGPGFARALLDVGLPQGGLPRAQPASSLGVEAGQILFIASVLAFGLVIARFLPGAGGQLAHWLRAIALAVGTLAAFRVIEGIAVFVT